MGTRIQMNDKPVVFHCNKKRACSKTKNCGSWCQHTTFIEDAIFDGEKQFEDCGGAYFEEP